MGRRPKVTREEVLSVARQVFAERGFEGTTLAAVQGPAGAPGVPAALRSAGAADAAATAPGPGRGLPAPGDRRGQAPPERPPSRGPAADRLLPLLRHAAPDRPHRRSAAAAR